MPQDEAHSVRDFLNIAGERLGLDWQKYVRDRSAIFPSDRSRLPARRFVARRVKRSGGSPKYRSGSLVEMMVDHDLELAKRETVLRDAGHSVAALR